MTRAGTLLQSATGPIAVAIGVVATTASAVGPDDRLFWLTAAIVCWLALAYVLYLNRAITFVYQELAAQGVQINALSRLVAQAQRDADDAHTAANRTGTLLIRHASSTEAHGRKLQPVTETRVQLAGKDGPE